MRWNSPVSGWILGASYLSNDLKAPEASMDGMPTPYRFKYDTQDFYSEYDYKKVTLSMEWNIEPSWQYLGTSPVLYSPSRIWYWMGTYHVTDRWSAGAYYSTDWGPEGNRDRSDPANYSHEAVVNTRFDFNKYFYLKVEGHYIDGDTDGLYSIYNPKGLERITPLYVMRAGFAF